MTDKLEIGRQTKYQCSSSYQGVDGYIRPRLAREWERTLARVSCLYYSDMGRANDRRMWLGTKPEIYSPWCSGDIEILT